MAFGKKRIVFILLIIFAAFALSGCFSSRPDPAANTADNDKTLVILSSSENKIMEPMIAEFAAKNGFAVKMDYLGSIDIMHKLESGANGYDGVWIANGMWLSMGDKGKIVKQQKSIMTSPVVFGIRESVAQKLGFTGRDIATKDILAAIEAGQLRFAMTSATQSNSGACAYIGFLYALAGNPETITPDHLKEQKVKDGVKLLLSGVNRSSGSSEWLKDLFLKSDYDAMVNYEAVIIDANKELVAAGKEPLHVVYPADGIAVADYILGYIDHGRQKKEEMFKKVQAFLLAGDTQSKIAGLGRRTGIGMSMDGADPAVFNPNWGINIKKQFSFIKMPSFDTLQEALNMYQTELRKPSYIVYCLDYSGSMAGSGSGQLKEAMKLVLNQSEAAKYMLQASGDDIVIVIPFNDKVQAVWKAGQGQEMSWETLLTHIEEKNPGGETDIYSPLIEALQLLKSVNTDKYVASVVLMTDGLSNTGKKVADFQKSFMELNKDIPVFCIMFGQASDVQLQQITNLTRANLFDGRNNLVEAFKKARGYL
ncbi:MAG TPA: substrate-binding domain-containing protein [Methylomusa anaerophila]|uniref:von Willebrand factor type A domain protein n=1 Tax=Methylomusa anaerophila TaxID=1930071 RepID=A0A348AJB9_9FIRM|nr:substrate-binding domain-containing protein [Methylomusa anaerophila]BBB91167.1 von Willebrand factor type A domain protein [Methylomusa anaerophila]HML89044.1 substrate-binding domain-containing protein [Methylomusa anaerophila]